MQIYILLIISILYIINIYTKYYGIKYSLIEIDKLKISNFNKINKDKKIIILKHYLFFRRKRLRIIFKT